MIPALVALALQADGWYLRSHIIWAKGMSFCPAYSGAVMPESVRDRPTSAHEAIFLLTKNERYWYDHMAVREPGETPRQQGSHLSGKYSERSGRNDGSGHYSGGFLRPDADRNLRNVWAIGLQAWRGSHYAVFPPRLVAPMLAAGCPRKVCAECGSPWNRVVDREKQSVRDLKAERAFHAARTGRTDGKVPAGWAPCCACGGDAVPGTVIDPFIGSGTVGRAAQDAGLRWIGIDIDPRNAELVAGRTAQQSLLGGG